MTKEQEAIERLNSLIKVNKDFFENQGNMIINKRDISDIETVLSMLKEKDKEIEKLKVDNENVWKLNANMSQRHLSDIFRIKKKDKQIDLMAKYMEENMHEYQLDEIYAKQYNCNGMERDWLRGEEKEVKDIKQYFKEIAERKSEEC